MLLVALCGLVTATGVVVFRAKADQWDKRTVLTTNQPIQVREKLLEPGQYVFKLLDSSSDRHIVQIFNADQTQLVETVLAIPGYRMQPTGKSQFTFWETPPGTARALRTWFYPGDNMGQEFLYPTQLARLESPAQAPPPSPAEPPQQEPARQEPPQEPERQEPPAPAPEPQALTTEPAQEQPVEVAQNTPPAEAPAAAPEAQPATLPKTASPLPLVGLTGLLSLGLGGLLRWKRSA